MIIAGYYLFSCKIIALTKNKHQPRPCQQSEIPSAQICLSFDKLPAETSMEISRYIYFENHNFI